MKQISAILIACFLFIGVSQVSAQQIAAADRTMVATDKYTFLPTDKIVIFTTVTAKSTCTLPPPEAGKVQIIRIFNRRSNQLTVTATVGDDNEFPILIPFKKSVEVMSDGKFWFLNHQSY